MIQNNKSERNQMNKDNQVLTPDEEIKQIKEYIQQVFFKENEDKQLKQQLLIDIQDLDKDDMKLDGDFYFHLYNIYQKIFSRQQQNLKEFKEFSTKIEDQRKQIEDKDQQIIKILDEHTSYKLEGIKSNLQLIDQQFIQLEKELNATKDDLDKHVSQICQTVEKTKDDFYKSIQGANLYLKTNKEYVQQIKDEQEVKKQKIQEYKRQQDDIKQEMNKTEKMLDSICQQMSVAAFDETKNYQLEQINRENELLQAQREKLDEQLSKKRLEFQNLIKSDEIIQKRQAWITQEVAYKFVKGRQNEQLKNEYEILLTEYNQLREKVSTTQSNIAKINQETALCRRKKELQTYVNLFLLFIIIIILFSFLYKFY